MKKNLTYTSLKIITLITMTIDHIGAFIIPNIDINNASTYYIVQNIETITRLIGRIAFPLFCFILVESFFHTSNKTKYIIRMLCFALVTQPIYAYAHDDMWYSLVHMNIFFTLAYGFILIWLIDYLKQYKIVGIIGSILLIIGSYFLVPIIDLQYGNYGIISILIFYLFHDKPLYVVAAFIINSFCFYNKYLGYYPNVENYIMQEYYATFSSFQKISTKVIMYCRLNSQLFGILCLPFICKYNKEKGRMHINKYFYYLYYPIHILIFYLIGKAI